MWDTAEHLSGEPYWSPHNLFVDQISQIPLQPPFSFPVMFFFRSIFLSWQLWLFEWLPWDKSITGIGDSPGTSRISWYFTCFLLLGNFLSAFPCFEFYDQSILAPCCYSSRSWKRSSSLGVTEMEWLYLKLYLSPRLDFFGGSYIIEWFGLQGTERPSSYNHPP